MQTIQRASERRRDAPVTMRVVALFLALAAFVAPITRADATPSRPDAPRMHTATWPAHAAARAVGPEYWREGRVAAPSSQVNGVRLEDVALMSNLSGSEFPPVDPTQFAVARRNDVKQSFIESASAGTFEPNGWCAVAATLALGIFFFLRRIVR